MIPSPGPSVRGRLWIEALAGSQQVSTFDGQRSVLTAEAQLGEERANFVSVVADPEGRFPRARQGEVGLEEGWALAALLREIISQPGKRVIVAIVDVPSQAYGRREEQLGIHLALAAAADAYASARLNGHPVVSLLVGGAMSGAFLAHGYQSNRIVALNDPAVLVQAMGKQAAARITRRTIAEVEALGESAPPMSYRVDSFARFGLVDVLIEDVHADAPTAADLARVRAALVAQVADIRRSGERDLKSRLASDAARRMRGASIEVRRRLAAQWNDGVPNNETEGVRQ